MAATAPKSSSGFNASTSIAARIRTALSEDCNILRSAYSNTYVFMSLYYLCVCVCACVRACVRAWVGVRACMRACVRACVRACACVQSGVSRVVFSAIKKDLCIPNLIY